MATAVARPKVIRLIPVLDFGGVESIFVLQSKLIDRTAFDVRVCTFWKKGAAARDVEATPAKKGGTIPTWTA